MPSAAPTSTVGMIARPSRPSVRFTALLLPTITSDQQYRAGRQALLAYNQRLAANNAVFEVRTDALAATFARNRPC